MAAMAALCTSYAFTTLGTALAPCACVAVVAVYAALARGTKAACLAVRAIDATEIRILSTGLRTRLVTLSHQGGKGLEHLFE